jgi:hypothetical protein
MIEEKDSESDNDTTVESEGDVRVLVTGYGVHDYCLWFSSSANSIAR